MSALAGHSFVKMNGLGNEIVVVDMRATPAQIALAWVIRQEGVTAIPRSGSPEHVRENAGALNIQLTARDIEEIDRAFPPPTKKRPLEST